MITEELKQLYQTHTGSPATEITELSSSGSNRRYFRLSGPVSLIGVSGTSIEENNAFIYMATHFREKDCLCPGFIAGRKINRSISKKTWEMFCFLMQ